MPAHRTPTHESMSQRGMSLIFIIGALVALGAIATGVTVFTPSSTLTEVYENNYLRAYHLSLSGIRAWPLLKSGLSDNTTYTYTIGSDKFTLSNSSIDVTSGKYTVISIGTAAAGTAQEANCRLTAKLSDPSATNTDKVGNVLSSSFETLQYDKKTKITTVEDFSPNTNEGVAKGSGRNVVSLETGVVGKAAYFDCSNYERIVYAGISAYNIYYSGTIMLWFNADNFNHQYAGLLHKGESTNTCAATNTAGQSVLVFSDEVYTLQFWRDSGSSVRLLFTLIDGAKTSGCASNIKTIDVLSDATFDNSDADTWYFVAVTWYYDSNSKKTTLKLYVNGVLDKTATASSFTPRVNDAPIVLGSQSDSSDYFDVYSSTLFCGAIDEVNVYNTPLYADDIKKYYCSVKPSATICK